MEKPRFEKLLKHLYSLVADLEDMFPGRPFTPDGHMVGSLGEAFASYHYDLELLPPSTRTHDARKNGLLVQVKATQRNRIALRSEPRHLLVLKISQDGSFERFTTAVAIAFGSLRRIDHGPAMGSIKSGFLGSGA